MRTPCQKSRKVPLGGAGNLPASRRPMRARCPRPTGGFTLIELLVVVGILVILLSILLPAIAKVKQSGYIASTTAELKGISSACDGYQAVFGGYPGVFAEADVASSHTASGNCLSGTQNLVISLMGQISTGTANVTINGSGACVITPPPSGGVVDLASGLGGGQYKQYAAFFAPKATDLTTAVTITPGANMTTKPYTLTTTTGATPVLSTLVDRFPDALPILYYRKTPNVDNPVFWNKPPVSASVPAAAFYRDCNMEYTDSTLVKAPSGGGFNETSTTGYGGLDGGSYTYGATTTPWPITSTYNVFGRLVSNTTSWVGGVFSNATATPVGGYVLMAAGPSRVYGNTNNNPLPSDTIVMTGGQ